jgi:hypothetical protein
MLSEFGRPCDIELRGHGSVGLSFEEWGNCLRLAKAFGWQPVGTVARGTNPRWTVVKAPADAWDGNYTDKEFQEVTDSDAKAFSLALTAGQAAWERVNELTMAEFDALRRIPRCFQSYVARVRDYAAKDGFLIS